MSTSPQHPKNVPGPFYVEDGCCTLCGVPEHVAPDLFASDDVDHCYVRRQPRSSAEISTMLRVVATQELGCIRYRGTDESILTRIAEMGEAEVCDEPPPDVDAKRRDRVSFAAASTLTAPALLERLIRAVAGTIRELKHTAIRHSEHGASVSVSWFADDYHHVELHTGAGNDRWTLVHAGPLGLSTLLSDALSDDPLFREQDWRTDAEEQESAPRKATPW